jgi:hypothetical protein
MMHKVTARNKWRVSRKEKSCLYASALSAVHNIINISSNTMLETLNLDRLRWYMHNDVHKVTARNKWRVLRN